MRSLLLISWLSAVVPLSAVTTQNPQSADPLPLEVAASIRGHNTRSTVDLSPDGEWVIHTVESDQTVERDTDRFGKTGFPFAEGDSRMEVVITNTKTGEDIRLGVDKAASWAGVWSPDGKRVAFYSDAGGEVGVWIWDRATKKAKRFPNVIARPFFGFEAIQWSADGQRLLCKILPAGMSVAAANALAPATEEGLQFPKVSPGAPSVIVRKAGPKPAVVHDTARASSGPVGDMSWATSDLAILDLKTQKATRLVERAAVRYYRYSPDDQTVGYTIIKGYEPNTQQPSFDLGVVAASGKNARTVGTNIRMGYGIEWSWSPDGKTIASIASGQLGDGRIVLHSLSGEPSRVLGDSAVPSFNPGEGEYPPIWDSTGKQLFAIGDGKLWRIDATTGSGTVAGELSGWNLRAMIGPRERSTLWTLAPNTGWAIARAADGSKAAIVKVDLSGGTVKAALEETKSYYPIFNFDVNPATGDVAFVSTDLQHLADVWLYDASDAKARQVSHLNPGMERYQLGKSVVIEWRGTEGQELRGALLLPPSYRQGQKLPLVVWVYGGANGSNYANRFGFWGDMASFNFHVLATRGYAVLFPDAPIRPGMPMKDLLGTVMPGVNAAIDQGYADPDRLAVMGQSYGSYSTLALITQTKRFKAAVITAAVLHPDLFADYLMSTGYYEQGQGNMGGTIWEFRDRYFANSPIFGFDQIETPLLIGQGSRDGRLIPSDAIFTALERLGRSVEYRIYENEGHVITQRPNVVDFWKRRLEFLAEHLNIAVDSAGAAVWNGNSVRSR